YRGTDELVRRDPAGAMKFTRRWTVEPDATAFQSTEVITVSIGTRRLHTTTTLSRASGFASLHYHVQENLNDVESTLSAASNYLPDPLIDPIVSRVARDPASGDALFSMVTLSDAGLASLYARPLAAPADRETDAVAMFLPDYWPVPIKHQYDRHGFLRREEHEDGLAM